MNDDRRDDDRALFEALHRLGVPLAGTDPMSAWWIVLIAGLALLMVYVFAGKQ